MLDNRLKKIAELVSGKGIAADVGTDHAYLAAELIKSGKCSRVTASDVKEGPLETARNTVEKYGIQDKLELVLSDGLDNVSLENVSDIIIAGMGGETIADIMERVVRDGRADKDINWILQPMSKPEVLRKWLYDSGFAITKELIAEEGGKLYSIMTAEYEPLLLCSLTEAESIIGQLSHEDEFADKYLRCESERRTKAAESMRKSGRIKEAVHFDALAAKLRNGIKAEKISTVIDFLNSLYPFDLQEKWDNSGYLVECPLDECRRVLLTLDITNEVIDEAYKKDAELIISHHPVIFDPRKRLVRNDPVYRLVENSIGALCMHTNLDIAKGGTNGVILDKLTEKLELSGEAEPFEELGGGNSLGSIIELKDEISARRLAEVCKEVFGCEYVRVSRGSESIRRIAFCSGSGGTMLETALSANCDALITGDIKHDVWVSAGNSGIALFDCGHFHTENIVLWELRRAIEEKFPELDIEIASASNDPCEYV